MKPIHLRRYSGPENDLALVTCKDMLRGMRPKQAGYFQSRRMTRATAAATVSASLILSDHERPGSTPKGVLGREGFRLGRFLGLRFLRTHFSINLFGEVLQA